MATLQLKGAKREGVGKGAARKLRREGLVPAVVYGGESAVRLILDQGELLKILGRKRGETAIFRLHIRGERKHRQVILKDIQLDPLRGRPLHVDLYEVSMDKEIKVSVPIGLVGEAPGVKRDGGLLHQLLRELEIECLPGSIPGEVTVDLSTLEIGDVIHVSALQLGEGVRVLTHSDEPVVTVARPEVEEVEVAAPEEEAAAAAEEVAGAPAEEPEAPSDEEA